MKKMYSTCFHTHCHSKCPHKHGKAKSYAIGRKAFLFHTSEAGAGASAVMYSIVETAKANNLNIFQYLYTVLLYMPDYMNSSAGIEQLMPWSDFIKEQCSGLIDVESNVPEKKNSPATCVAEGLIVNGSHLLLISNF